MAERSPWIIDVDVRTFPAEVMKRSDTTPVVLDFWAPWCQPCKQLAPILEKLANEYAGRFILAKINVEEEQQIAAAFGISSIPLVVAFVGGRPVDQFAGIMQEAEIRRWIDQLLPSPSEMLANEAIALEESDPKAAESKYRESLELDEENHEVRICLARVLLKQGRLDESQRQIDRLAARGYLEDEAQRLQSELDVRTAAAESGGVEQARLAMEADPANISKKVLYAEALAANQQFVKALEFCLNIVKEEVGDSREAAKQAMVKIFDMLGPSSELVGEFRRKLATALY